MTAKVISIINLKGGVGKSTLTMVLGEYLAFRDGKRVLLIDMDAQANLSYCMVPEGHIGNQERNGRTIYHFFKAALSGTTAEIGNFITQPPLVVSNIQRSSAIAYPGVLDMIISTPSVAQLEDDLIDLWEANKPIPLKLRHRLAEALDVAKERYDYILVDCPPGLSIFSSAALVGSDYFVSPIVPEPLSLQGVELVKRRATDLKTKHSAKVEFKGVVLNRVLHYRATHPRVAQQLHTEQVSEFQPFRYWVPDVERLRKLGEFDPDFPGTWAAGVGAKFHSVYGKYDVGYLLRNPGAGSLSLVGTEGKEYKLHERLARLVDEFTQRCS